MDLAVFAEHDIGVPLKYLSLHSPDKMLKYAIGSESPQIHKELWDDKCIQQERNKKIHAFGLKESLWNLPSCSWFLSNPPGDNEMM